MLTLEDRDKANFYLNYLITIDTDRKVAGGITNRRMTGGFSKAALLSNCGLPPFSISDNQSST